MYVLTLFDYSSSPIRPLASLTYDGNSTNFHTFFIRGTGKKLHKVFEDIAKFRDIINNEAVFINDFKSHIEAFDLEIKTDYNIHELSLGRIDQPADSVYGTNVQIALARQMKLAYGIEKESWRMLLANALCVYHWLEKRGIYDGYRNLEFRYDLTKTGRSKTLGFNVQGTTEDCDLKLDPNKSCFYVHLDWISADIRVASIMSGDLEMQSAFAASDPYERMAEWLGPNYTRDECKMAFLKPLYSLETDASVFELFPQFKAWMEDRICQAEMTGHIESILGRKFYYDGDNLRSIFSGMIQGSVAHAMQNVLIRLFQECPENILTETHDSITLVCDERSISKIIDLSSKVMLHPLDGYLKENPAFPLKVYVGDRWKHWKVLKEYRHG